MTTAYKIMTAKLQSLVRTLNFYRSSAVTCGLITFLLSLSTMSQNIPVDTSSTEMLFGPEWTFTNQFLLRDDTKRLAYLDKFHTRLMQRFLGHNAIKNIEKKFDSIEIQLADGSSFTIEPDNGVLEVTSTARSITQWKKEAEFFQNLIFDTMKEIGLRPHDYAGAGHMNIGVKYFMEGKNLASGLLTRFIKDYLSHPGVGEVLNSPEDNPVNARSPRAHIEHWYYAANEHYFELFMDSLKQLQFSLKNQFSVQEPAHILGFLLGKSVAIALRGSKIIKTGTFDIDLDTPDARLEVRQVKPQKSIWDFISVAEIFESRTKFLEANPKKVNMNRILMKLSARRAVGQFADYLEESGLDWRNYKSVMTRTMRNFKQADLIRDPHIVKARVTVNSIQCQMLFH